MALSSAIAGSNVSHFCCVLVLPQPHATCAGSVAVLSGGAAVANMASVLSCHRILVDAPSGEGVRLTWLFAAVLPDTIKKGSNVAPRS